LRGGSNGLISSSTLLDARKPLQDIGALKVHVGLMKMYFGSKQKNQELYSGLEWQVHRAVGKIDGIMQTVVSKIPTVG